MRKNMLITRPDHDDETAYFHAWSSYIIKHADDKGFNVIDLEREKANKVEIEARLSKQNPELVILNGL